jgi:hypothetical protein
MSAMLEFVFLKKFLTFLIHTLSVMQKIETPLPHLWPFDEQTAYAEENLC